MKLKENLMQKMVFKIMLKTYLILIAATFFEVAGTMLLPVTKGF